MFESKAYSELTRILLVSNWWNILKSEEGPVKGQKEILKERHPVEQELKSSFVSLEVAIQSACLPKC